MPDSEQLTLLEEFSLPFSAAVVLARKLALHEGMLSSSLSYFSNNPRASIDMAFRKVPSSWAVRICAGAAIVGFMLFLSGYLSVFFNPWIIDSFSKAKQRSASSESHDMVRPPLLLKWPGVRKTPFEYRRVNLLAANHSTDTELA